MTHHSPDLDAAIQALRRDYLAGAAARLAEIRRDVDAWRAGEADAVASLKTRFHRLAGSGGSYGFPDISTAARRLEESIDSFEHAEATDQLDYGLTQLAAAFDRAADELGVSAEGVRGGSFPWRALVIGSPDPLRRSLEDGLVSATFVVRAESQPLEPEHVPPAERPDLVVVIAGSDDHDPYASATVWSAQRSSGTRAVVMIDAAGSVDRLRAAMVGVDAVFSAERAESDLPTYAKSLARIGVPPPNVVLVEDDVSLAEWITVTLEQADVRVRHYPEASSAYTFLTREQPDLLLLDIGLPELDGFALARLVRQDPRLSLTPIVFLTCRTTVHDQVEAVRAGGDDFLTKPVDVSLLLQTVLTRAERGRRIRELVHRDGLTGALNHATLLAELEHGIEYARRHRESLAFLMIDLDHFKRVNDRHGHLAGDQVLRHVARIFQSSVRASDLLGRYGGEEFGIVLRRCGAHGAAVVATKLREAALAQPATTAAGVTVPIHLSVGVATFPADGVTAMELTSAADRALYLAKGRGRNRVEYADTETFLDR